MGAKSKKNKRPASEIVENEGAPVDATNSSIESSHRKKKKVTEEGIATTEKKISKRQMKREKLAQRMAEAEMDSQKEVQRQALSYLSLWKYNKAEWKFNKVKQIWLYKHKFDETKVPEELWRPFVEYFSASTGGIKQLITSDSNKVIKEMEDWIEKNQESSTPEDKPSESSYRRARDLLQNIQE